MITPRSCLFSIATLAVAPLAAQEVPRTVDGVDGVDGVETRVELRFELSTADRPAPFTGMSDLLATIARGPRREKLVRRAQFQDGSRTVALWLPAAESYTTANVGADSTAFENKSTLLSIDDDGDGVLTERESWHANLPLRIGDAMWEIVELAPDGTRLVLERSKGPLSGIVIGRRVPEFELKTAEGQVFSHASLEGKPFVLDLWSIT